MITLVPVSAVLAADHGLRPPQAIDLDDPGSASYWAGRLNVTQQELVTAVSEVGPSVAAVRRHLAK